MDDKRGPTDPMEAVRKAWAEDAEYRERVRENPKRAFAELGLELPPVDVRVVENDDEVTHVAFPPNPDADLSGDELTATVGGSSSWVYDGGGWRYRSVGGGGAQPAFQGMMFIAEGRLG